MLVAFLGDVLTETCVDITARTATRLTGKIIRDDAPALEDQRTRRASMISLVRDIVASMAYGHDGLLGLYGSFAYDLVFQFEDLEQKRARW